VPFSGAALAFGLSAVLDLLAGIATCVDALDAALVVFVARLTCATSAVGVHSTVTNVAPEGPRWQGRSIEPAVPVCPHHRRKTERLVRRTGLDRQEGPSGIASPSPVRRDLRPRA
jgi:hypothetical protein